MEVYTRPVSTKINVALKGQYNIVLVKCVKKLALLFLF